MPLPPFPTESLAGTFPSFPVGYVNVPDLIDLPSYIYSVTTYYGNPLNYPYPNPPIITSWSIPYPLLGEIPSFFLNVVVWLLGWGGAILEWTAQAMSYGAITLGDMAISDISGAFNATVSLSFQISSQTGILQPLILTSVIGVIASIFIVVAAVIINAIRSVS